MTKLIKLTRELLRAGVRLSKSEGRISRRNARREALNVLSKIRQAIDEEFPAIRLPSRCSRKRRTVAEQRDALRRKGWIGVDGDPELLSKLAVAKIPMRRIKGTIYPDVYTTFAPKWAAMIGDEVPSKLNAAKHNVMLRKALVTELTLKGVQP